MSVAAGFQAVVIAALKADADVAALVAERVLEEAQASAVFPHLALGPWRSRAWNAGGERGEEIVFGLVAYVRRGGRGAALNLIGRCGVALDGAALSVEGARVVGVFLQEARWRSTRTARPGARRGSSGRWWRWGEGGLGLRAEQSAMDRVLIMSAFEFYAALMLAATAPDEVPPSIAQDHAEIAEPSDTRIAVSSRCRDMTLEVEIVWDEVFHGKVSILDINERAVSPKVVEKINGAIAPILAPSVRYLRCDDWDGWMLHIEGYAVAGERAGVLKGFDVLFTAIEFISLYPSK